MRKFLLLICLLVTASGANAVLVERYTERPLNLGNVVRSNQTGANSSMGVNTHVFATGQGNTVGNWIGVIKGGSSIRGNASINAFGASTTAVAIGNGNTATNDIGTIGGW